MNIYDIADKAGVSIATVSRVLNNSPKVSGKTRQRILSVIESEDYVPNAFARGLGLDTMRMVGVMCTDVTDNFYAAAVGFIEGFCRDKNLNIMLRCTGSDIESKKQHLDYLINQKVDAIIMVGSAFKESGDNSHIRIAARSVPIIIINGYIDFENVYCVVCEERNAVKSLVKDLVAAEHRKILYLYDTLTFSGEEKLEGYKEGCRLYSAEQSDRLTVKTERSVEGAFNTVEELLKKGTEFDAVVTSEDIIAVGALKAVLKNGKDCPVIGFNNSVIAECSTPALSSVDNAVETLCKTAVDLLSNIRKNKQVPRKITVSAKLVQRETFKKDE